MNRTLRTSAVSILALATLAGTAVAPDQAPEPAAAPPVVAKADESRIDVVFVLDSTGSMGGLIEGAKQKIWAIANQIAAAKPRPRIRMALVTYRDRGDSYITQVTPLTDDLDALYADLMKITADGGGDGPESVNQALNEAVTKIAWDASAPNYLKLVYLVGDAPPHMDYDQDVKYLDSCKRAATAGITVNTIQCGSQADTAAVWQEIARSAEGEYFQIDQGGGMTAVATPYDADLSRLGAELEATVVAYGTAEQQTRQLGKMSAAETISAAAPARPEAAAERAAYKASDAGRASLTGRYDLVQACTDGTVKLDDLKKEELPEQMRPMSADERAAYIAHQTAARDKAASQINELSDKRQAYLREQLGKVGAADSFDRRVLEALKAQAARRGITYQPN
jgi:Mg-chelatase subunit ChlD